MNDWTGYVEQLGRAARRASGQLATLRGDAKVDALQRIADSIRQQSDALIDANASDIAAAQQADLAPALIARLKLDQKRIAGMAEGVEQIARQTDPVGQIIEGYVRPNGLRIQK